ncbi:hypothetical protein Pmani_007415 [Petrolisthes manimaculis]|uniref:Uncharacterized protein n=1 Tax=Petrolisthes manimaculis TaxID=1843537 RepID=A0AAE1Q8F4_9EUCA|nr:hypothetical protein Pmani_007415 [Petrolisthes manimaculis]
MPTKRNRRKKSSDSREKANQPSQEEETRRSSMAAAASKEDSDTEGETQSESSEEFEEEVEVTSPQRGRGEIGATAMETRLMKTKMTFLRYLLNKEDSLVGRVFQEMKINFKEDTWTQQIMDITKETGLSKLNIKTLSKDKIKQIMKDMIHENGEQN